MIRIGFWLGILLIAAGALHYISLGVLSGFAIQLLPLLSVAGGIYLLVKG